MVNEDFMLIHFTNESFTRSSIFAEYTKAKGRFIDVCRSIISRCNLRDVEYGFVKSYNSLGLDITDFGLTSNRKEFRGVVFIINITEDQLIEIEDDIKCILHRV
jgi:hypothetical protein